MLPRKDHTLSLTISRSRAYFHFKIAGLENPFVKFELIDLDGNRLRKQRLIYGSEFFISSEGLSNDEYLYTISTDDSLIYTGVLTP
ncbi:MAG: hypothetical protein Salg2KO_14160 [Salibacteraceae bacterium]